MAKVGYARVSSVGQSLDSQLERLGECDKVFQEKLSGTDGKRPQLRKCLGYLQQGDTLFVTKLDRLARSTPDLYKIIHELDHNGVGFKVLDDPTIDTNSRTGKLVMGILALIAEFENDIRRERQLEGIRRAKENGTRFGPPPKVTPDMAREIHDRRALGESPDVIARDMNLGRATVYRTLANGKRQEDEGRGERIAGPDATTA